MLRSDELELVGLSAERSWEELIEQARAHGVERIALADEDAAARAAEAWTDGRVLGGAEGLVRLVVESDADLVLNALVGSAGPRSDGRDARRGHRPGARQQGVAGRRRRARTALAEATGARIVPSTPSTRRFTS